MNRRDFLGGASAALALSAAPAPAVPAVDAHIHLFDPRRPEGIPWPPKENALLYKPALPDRYHGVIGSLPVLGAIEVEASPRVEDNQWVLDTIARDPIMVGTIGNLEPGQKDFPRLLERFHKSPLFLGIRYGNLWDRELHAQLARPEFIADIGRLASAGLTLDSANPTPALIADLVRLTDRVPTQRLVVDHLPQMTPPTGAAHAAFAADLRKLAANPNVWIKISEVHRRVDGRVPAPLSFYRDRLDMLYRTFGPSKVIYGSDWPNSDQWADYPAIYNLVREYFAAKGPEATEKYFWTNSIAAYRWKPRTAAQRRA